MIIAGTGHRPAKLGGYDPHIAKRLIDIASDALVTHQASTVISGMALGWDMAVAEAAINLDIPFHAYIPFAGQELVWPMSSKLVYNSLLRKAQQVIICSEGDFSKRAMQIRNERMVDNCDMLIALWDGSNGGTANCLMYATQMHRRYINYWSQFIDPSSPPGSDWLEP
jgi:uncharacterized phage-like protein YoqJ